MAAEGALGVMEAVAPAPAAQDEGGLDNIAGVIALATVGIAAVGGAFDHSAH